MNAEHMAAIAGVGIDTADVARIRKLLENYGEAFLEKTFTKDEVAYCSSKADPAVHYAGRFAAKEAMAKALGTGFSGEVSMKGVSVSNNENGTPEAVLDEGAARRMKELGGAKILVSITHLKDHAQAVAIISR